MASSMSLTVSLFCLISVAIFPSFSFAGDPYVFYDFRVSYITASPLGIPQRVCFCLIVYCTPGFAFVSAFDLDFPTFLSVSPLVGTLLVDRFVPDWCF